VLITAVIIGLCAYVVWQGMHVERRRRRAEDALRQSEAKYRLLAETAGEFILTSDLDGIITYANRTCREAELGGTAASPPTRIADILSEAHRVQYERMVQSRLEGSTRRELTEVDFKVQAGRPIPVEMSLSLMRVDRKPVGVLISARDITEKKMAADQARLHQEQLFQASKMASIGILVSGVAHEINNPIATILLNAPIVEKVWQSAAPILDDHCARTGSLKIGGMQYGQLSARMPRLLAGITDSARRVKKIVGDLKDFARQSPPEMNDQLNINTAVEKAISLVSNLIKKSTEHFSVAYHPDIPTLSGNTQRIEQVVVNLLVNACQALTDNERSIKVSTHYDAVQHLVSIEVQDQGVGIAVETAKHIKDPFFTTKRDTGGTGLGLSISDRIVRDHGGFMEFFSEVGRGTTVKVGLPVKNQTIQSRGQSA
jgi:PAS domain S-box-containing protein